MNMSAVKQSLWPPLAIMVVLASFFIANITTQYVQNDAALALLEEKVRTEVNGDLIPKSNNYFGLPGALQGYMAELNEALKTAQWNVRIHRIGETALPQEDAHWITVTKSSLVGVEIDGEQVNVAFNEHYDAPLWWMVGIGAVFGLMWLYMCFAYGRRSSKLNDVAEAVQSEMGSQQTASTKRLIIDYEKKELRFNREACKDLSLKEFAFYTALLEFCAGRETDIYAEHSMPASLLSHAKQNYKFLKEAGHTVRARPDFESGVTKTMSIIRKKFDEAFTELPDRFIPPKSSGAGSREKGLGANIALKGLREEDFKPSSAND